MKLAGTTYRFYDHYNRVWVAWIGTDGKVELAGPKGVDEPELEKDLKFLVLCYETLRAGGETAQTREVLARW